MKNLPILLTLFLHAACGQSTQPFTEDQAHAVQDSVTVVLHRYYADIKQEGLLAEFRYLDSSAAFYWMPPGFEETIEYDSVAALIRRNAKALAVVDNRWDMLDVQPLAEDRASYSGRIHSITKDTAGKTSETYLVESGLLMKRSDGWKLLSGQTRVLKP